MRVLEGILKDSEEYYLKLEKDIRNKLVHLAVGSIKIRVISGKKYYYIQKRNKHKVIHKYVGKEYPEALEKSIKERVLLKKELKKVLDSIKLLKKTKGRKRD